MIERALFTWLVNALWLIPLVAAAAALAARFGRLGPRGRHGAWLAALVLAVTLPALPAAFSQLGPAPAASAPRVVPAAPSQAVDAASRIASRCGARASCPPLAAARKSGLEARAPTPSLAFDLAWTRAILLLAGLAVALALGRLARAAKAGAALARAARPVDLDPALGRTLAQLAARHGRKPPPVLESTAIASPAVVGAVSPKILIPPGFLHLSQDEQRAALLHELAHVVRRDYAWNLACEAVSLPAAWHPAIFPIKAGVRRSRETACDALAAEAMASRVTYAKCLVSLVGRLGTAQASPAVLVGLIGKSDLEERLMTLLTPRPGRAGAALRLAGAAAIAAAVLAPALFLRVTPAFAERSLAARPLAPIAPVAPVAPVADVAPVAPIAPTGPAEPAVAMAPAPQFASADAVAAIQEPPPPPPPPPPARRALAAQGRYDEIVRRAVDQAMSAEKVMESGEVRRAMAELAAHRGELAQIDRAKIRAEVASAMAEIKNTHLKETLDQLRAQLQSPEFRNGIADAARAAADAQIGDLEKSSPPR